MRARIVDPVRCRGEGWERPRPRGARRSVQIGRKMEALRAMRLPPGFGFHPSDAELISHYLKRKVHGQRIEYDLIPEVDIYKHEPWDLPSKCNLPIKDNKWHFFGSRDRKYPTGARSNRTTRAGYWKSTGKDRAIKLNRRTLGTKKTLVFHEGRPPTGKRTEWIMHEYYIDENECRVSPDMKDAFVLCRVTRRDEWALENDSGVGNRNPHPQNSNDTAAFVPAEKQEDHATSVVIAKTLEAAGASVVIAKKQEDAATSGNCAGEANHAGTPVSAELSNDIVQAAFMGRFPNSDSELQALMEELADLSSKPAVDTDSAGLSLIGQDFESSNMQNIGFMGTKIEPDHASPTKNGIDNIFQDILSDFNNYFATSQVYSMMETNHATFPNNPEGNQKEELLLHQGSRYANLSNENAENGITVRRRSVTSSASSSASTGRIKLQVGVNRMVTSNSETINQTMEFAGNSSRMRSFNQSDAIRSSENHSKQGNSDATRSRKKISNQRNLTGTKGVFRSSAGFKYIFACICMIIVIAALLHGYCRSGISL